MRNHDGEPMKVVVYFRQAGGTVAKTYPLITHWTEDEDEQPVPLFSQFDMDAMADAAPEILVQLQSANRWLKEKRGAVVASFTEMEDGSGRRPSNGAARKAASRERATILIAMTTALGGQRFAPISQDGLEVIRLKDPEDAASESWARITELNIITSRAELSAYSRASANSCGIAVFASEASSTPQVISVK